MDYLDEKKLQQDWIRLGFAVTDDEMVIFLLPADIGRLVRGKVYELEWVDADGDVRWRSPVIYDGSDAEKLYFYYLISIDSMTNIVRPDEFGKFSIKRDGTLGFGSSLGSLVRCRLVWSPGLISFYEIARRKVNMAKELESDKIRAGIEELER